MDALKNATHQQKSTVKLGHMRPRGLTGSHQWHSPSSWNIEKDFYYDVYTILNRI